MILAIFDLIDNTGLNTQPVLGSVVDPNPHATMPSEISLTNLAHGGHIRLGRVAFCYGLTSETGLGAAPGGVLRNESRDNPSF
jgi:hypothetical protein